MDNVCPIMKYFTILMVDQLFYLLLLYLSDIFHLSLLEVSREGGIICSTKYKKKKKIPSSALFR